MNYAQNLAILPEIMSIRSGRHDVTLQFQEMVYQHHLADNKTAAKINHGGGVKLL